MDLKNTVENSFSAYAAMTIQQRAIVDARDFIKPSARVCFYAQKLEKIDSQHPIQPSPTSVGAALKHFYVHGDTSCYNLLCRFGKEYVSRYTLEDFHGSTGTLLSSESQAASRYTKMRLNSLGDKLFEGIEKDCIDKWYDNFSSTEKYPAVLPSLGFYNIVNGTTGIATGIASSVPQFNLKEVNEAMIKLLWNRDIDFDSIYCAPDFVGGGIILNSDEVKESLKKGTGKSCKIRSKAEYNEKDNAIVITEIPYGVYTDLICRQIINLVENEEIIGIDRVNDLTGATPNIKIYLTKKANPQFILKKIFKHTSLQYYFPINMTMLENGTTPKTFGWREALLCHIDHEIDVRQKIHKFEINKIVKRLHIIDGILIAIANIDEVVSLIRSSDDKKEATRKLIERFKFSEFQTEAILKMTLSRLIHLELQSFVDEKEKLIIEKKYHEDVLSDVSLLYKEIEDDFRETAIKYGDERRTKCINLDFESEDDDAEPIEEKEIIIYYTSSNNIYAQETTTLMNKKRVKLDDGEICLQEIHTSNSGTLTAFTKNGKAYFMSLENLPLDLKRKASAVFNIKNEEVIGITCDTNTNFIFVTKNGMIKKTAADKCTMARSKSTSVINLKNNDEVIKVFSMNTGKIGILTFNGRYILIDIDSINLIGKTGFGVCGINLEDGDYVIDSIDASKNETVIVSNDGYIKKVSSNEYHVQTRAGKGVKISKIRKNDRIVKVLTIGENNGIIVTDGKETNVIKSIQLATKTTVGTKLLKNGFLIKNIVEYKV